MRSETATETTPLRVSRRRSLRSARRSSRLEHLAGREHALGDAEGQLARHQRLGKLDLRIEHLVAMLVADGEDVAEAFGDEQRGERALALDHRVGDDRGRVDHARRSRRRA